MHHFCPSPPISHEEPSVAAAPSVIASPSSPLCHGALAYASGSQVLSWVQGSDRGQGSATVTGARGHACSARDPQGPEMPWEGETVLPWHRDSPQRLLGWAPPSPPCPAHKHCGNTLCSPGPMGELWGCPVLLGPCRGTLGVPCVPQLCGGILGLPSAPQSHAGVPHTPWPCAAQAAHTAPLHCTSGMGTQMGHPARHRKGQTHAPCFRLGSLSPQLFIFTHYTTIPVFTRLYLLYCVSWCCMYQRCPRPRRGHPVQPEPKCQCLKKCLNKPHVCTDTAPSLLPWAHARLAPGPRGTDGGGRGRETGPAPRGAHMGLARPWHPHAWLHPAKSFP